MALIINLKIQLLPLNFTKMHRNFKIAAFQMVLRWIPAFFFWTFMEQHFECQSQWCTKFTWNWLFLNNSQTPISYCIVYIIEFIFPLELISYYYLTSLPYTAVFQSRRPGRARAGCNGVHGWPGMATTPSQKNFCVITKIFLFVNFLLISIKFSPVPIFT